MRCSISRSSPRTTPRREITWAIRRPALGQLLGGARQDQLEERGKLGARVRALLDEGRLELVTGFRHRSRRRRRRRRRRERRRSRPGAVDEIIAATGFRPDWSILSEVRLDLDPAVESPRALAPLIDPNVHSCGTVPPHGAEELKQPDAQPLRHRHEELRPRADVPDADRLRAGALRRQRDRRRLGAARRVELVLPETGVCSLDGPAAEDAAGCCVNRLSRFR